MRDPIVSRIMLVGRLINKMRWLSIESGPDREPLIHRVQSTKLVVPLACGRVREAVASRRAHHRKGLILLGEPYVQHGRSLNP